MVTAVVILILLTIAASLASWLFGEWLAGRTRVSSTALALGGGGAMLLIGTVAYLAIGATTWWQRFMPVVDSSPLLPPAAALPAAVPEWPATNCVAARYAEKAGRWMMDNGCDAVVAVALQSCELGGADCRWRSEPAGILMTAMTDKPVLLRVTDGGPLVAPIFTIPDVAGTKRQIRYAACLVTAPRVLRLLQDSGGDEMAQQRLVTALRDDACYSQVLRWSSGDRQLTTFSTGNLQ